MADLLAATNLGKPLLLTGEMYDYFDRRGVAEAHRDLTQLYSAIATDGGFDVAEQLPEPFLGGNTHGWGEGVVHAIAQFFCRHAGLPPPPPRAEMAACQVLEGTDSGGGQRLAPLLWATPEGDVLRSSQQQPPPPSMLALTPRPLWEILREQAVGSGDGDALSQQQLAGAVSKLLGLAAEPTRPPPHYRILKSRKLGESGSLGRNKLQTKSSTLVKLAAFDPCYGI